MLVGKVDATKKASVLQHEMIFIQIQIASWRFHKKRSTEEQTSFAALVQFCKYHIITGLNLIRKHPLPYKFIHFFFFFLLPVDVLP